MVLLGTVLGKNQVERLGQSGFPLAKFWFCLESTCSSCKFDVESSVS